MITILAIATLVFGLLIVAAWKMKPRRRHPSPLIEYLINIPGFLAYLPLDGESPNIYAEAVDMNEFVDNEPIEEIQTRELQNAPPHQLPFDVDITW